MLNPLEMERFIAATAKRADLTVEWHPGVMPYTTKDKMVLPTITAGMSVPEYRMLRKSVTHEVNHQRYSNLNLWEETGASADKSLLGAIWNLAEDQRIDHLGALDYEGDRLNDDGVHGVLLEDIVKNVRRMGTTPNKEVDAILPLLGMNEALYKDFYPSAHLAHEEMERLIADRPAAKAIYDKLMAGDYTDVLRNARQDPTKKGTSSTLELAKRIFKEVYGLDPEKELERLKEKGKGPKGEGEEEGEEGEGEGEDQPGEEGGEGEGNDGEGEGDGKGEGEKDGESKGDKAKAGKPKGKGSEKGEGLTKVDWSPYMSDPHEGVNKSKRGLHINYPPDGETGTGTYIPAVDKDYQVVDLTKRSMSTSDGEGYRHSIQNALSNTSSGFAHKVRTILQIRARDHYQYGLKRGKLNGGSLYRVTMADAPGFNERVFKRKEVNNVLDAAVSVLVDGSGSMSGKKYEHAAATGVMLNDTIANALHIPTEVVSFSTPSSYHSGGWSRGRGCAMYIHRTYNDKLVSRDNIINRFAYAGSFMSGNPDGDAIMWMFDRLMKRKEKRKLLIVCSDGSPAGGGCGDDMWYAQKVVRSIEVESPVSIVGIGIMDRNVARIYKEHYVIKAADELERALLSVIENKLK